MILLLDREVQNNNLFGECEKNMKDKYDMACKTIYLFIIFGFVLLNYSIIAYGREIHHSTYDRKINNCRHMSSQLEGMFEKLFIPVTIKVGSIKGGASHMWISLCNIIDIDSVTLRIYQNNPYNHNVKIYESFDDYENR